MRARLFSWRIEEGHYGDVQLEGLAAALVIRYSDDEPGSPWSIILHLDERGDERQRQALEDIFLGRLSGPGILQLPWVRKPSHLLDVRVGWIDSHDGELRVDDAVRLTATRPWAGCAPTTTPRSVACVSEE